MSADREPPDAETDLARRLDGDVDFGQSTRTSYATDASIYRVEPTGVVAASRASRGHQLHDHGVETRHPMELLARVVT